jgi:4'-phosphopantetheinyl transferase
MTPAIQFEPPPADLALTSGEIQIFCASLDLSPSRLECLAKTLSADERGRAARFYFARDGNRFLAGRGILREILAWLLGGRPDELIFSNGINGKPRLAALVATNDLHFNLAHSDSLVIYAVSRAHEVGIDLERIRPIQDAEEIAAHFFHERERAQWHSLSSDQKTAAFFDCWTRKEALLKASGEGLGGPMEQIDTFAPVNPWSLQSLTPAVDYAAAVAAKCRNVRIRCWQWPGEGLMSVSEPS